MERIVKQIVIHIHLGDVFNMCNLIKIRLINVTVNTFSRQRNGLNKYDPNIVQNILNGHEHVLLKY